jgi:hypothetical protein
MPHETEMQAWSRSAAAHVEGEKIYFQERHSLVPEIQHPGQTPAAAAGNRTAVQTAQTLCPQLLDIMLDTLTGELGFDSYIDYCSRKKGIDYTTASTIWPKGLSKKPMISISVPWKPGVHDRFGLP